MKPIRFAIAGLLVAVGGVAHAQQSSTIPVTSTFVEVEWKRIDPIVQTRHYTAEPERIPNAAPVTLPMPTGVPTTLPAVRTMAEPGKIAATPAPVPVAAQASEGSCPAIVAACCQPCGPQGRMWFEGEYLLWWAKGASSPPLASFSPAGTPIEQAGVLGTPGATTTFGNQRLNNGLQMGFQTRAGIWLDDCHKWGLEGGFMLLGGDSTNNVAGSPTGATIVSRPFFNALSGQPDAQLVSFPGVLNGTVSVNSQISQIWGYDVLGRKQLCCIADDCADACGTSGRFNNYRRWDLLVGYRHYYFSDETDITENLFPQDPAVVPGTQIIVQDQFRARTRFDGIVLGIAGERTYNRLYLQGAIKLNVGQVTREVSIYGQTTVNVPGEGQSIEPGGLLALNSNIGTYRDTDWTVIPETQLRVGYRITQRMTAYAGYNLIVWPKVARAAEQIDPAVNTNLIPPVIDNSGPARPAFFGPTSTLWIQGVSLGVNLQF